MVWSLIIYLVINLFLLGLGTGIGFLFHWILPTVDLGVGILIGVVTTIASVNLFLRLNRITEQIEDEALLQEISSRLTLRAMRPVAVKRSGKQKTPESRLPRP